MRYLLIVLLAGCSQLPSVKNCQHVTYTRDYSLVKIYAECDTSKSGTEE